MVGDTRDELTIEQVAERLQINYYTAYHKVRSGEIPGYKLGRHWRVSRSDLEAYIKQLKKSSR